MQLTSRDLLALAFTGYASQRAMASDMGVTHQKLGRWLRGESKIPGDAFTQRGIETIFNAHMRRVRKWTAAQGLPYIGPVMPDRRPLDKLDPQGRQVLGDRVVIHHAQFIRQELRDAIVAVVHSTTAFMGVSVKSVVDLYSYFKRGDTQWDGPGTPRRTIEQRDHRESLAHKLEPGTLYLGVSWQPKPATAKAEIRSPIYTKVTSLSRARTTRSVIEELNAKLRAKHEPATVKPGTVLASEILLQLYPIGYKPPATKRDYKGPRPRTAERRARGTIRTQKRKGRPAR